MRSSLGKAMALTVFAVVLMGGIQPAAVHGQPADSKAIDTQVYNTLRTIINQGADLFNEPNHDHNGCYRLYEGALVAIKPSLSHRPALQKAIDDGIAAARTRPDLAGRAFALRSVIDKIRAEINPNPKPTTLWDKLGGEANVKKVIDDFVATTAPDPKVDFTRGGKYPVDVPKLKKALLDQISDATGGPYKYKGKSMKEIHKGMAITDAQFDAAAAHLQKALDKNGAKPEDAKAVMTVIGSTRGDIVEKKSVEPPKMTLWEKLGGEATVKKVVDDFVTAAATDPKVDFFRVDTLKNDKYKLDAAGVAKLKQLLIDQISDATGGPRKYKGRSMKEVHKGMHISDAQFDALAGHLQKALDKNGAKPEDAKAVMTVIGSTRGDIVEKKPEPPKDKPSDKDKPKDKEKAADKDKKDK